MKKVWKFLNRDVTVSLYVYLLDFIIIVAACATLWGSK